MRYLFLALIPLLFTGCVVRMPYARYNDPVIYYDYDDGYPHGHGRGHGRGGHYRSYRY